MVKIEWAWTAAQCGNPPVIEIDCTEAELTEAKELGSNFIFWVSEITSGATHAEAMDWAKRA